MTKTDQHLVIELTLPLAGMECAGIRCFDSNGKEISQNVSRVEIDPIFYRKDSVATAMYARTLARKTGLSDRELHRQIVSVAGNTGDLKIRYAQVAAGPACLLDDAPETSSTEPVA